LDIQPPKGENMNAIKKLIEENKLMLAEAELFTQIGYAKFPTKEAALKAIEVALSAIFDIEQLRGNYVGVHKPTYIEKGLELATKPTEDFVNDPDLGKKYGREVTKISQKLNEEVTGNKNGGTQPY
jgi:hypothetical protein